MINYIPRRFTVIRDKELCINCGCCVRQCSNECHFFDEDGKTVLVNSKNCVACHRCVDLCPTGALRIEKYVIIVIMRIGHLLISRKSAVRQKRVRFFFPLWVIQSLILFIGIKSCLMHHRLPIRLSTLFVNRWKFVLY